MKRRLLVVALGLTCAALVAGCGPQQTSEPPAGTPGNGPGIGGNNPRGGNGPGSMPGGGNGPSAPGGAGRNGP